MVKVLTVYDLTDMIVGSKLLECIVVCHLIAYLSSADLLPTLQSSFQLSIVVM